MPTINAATGKLISGVDEVFQSINCIFATAKGTRIERRTYGANRSDFQDKGISQNNLVDFYADIADALKAEPRFRLTKVRLAADSDPTAGHAIFDLEGVYYPRGHLGDYSEAVTLKRSVTWNDPGPAIQGD